MKNKKIIGIIYLLSIPVYFMIIAGSKYIISNDLPETIEPTSISEIFEFGKQNPNAPMETSQLAPLIGNWNCISMDLVNFSSDSAKWYTNRATWRWEYILGGHALLNNWWQEDSSPNPISKEYFAAGIFIFNPKSKLWEATIMNSRPHKISPKFQLKYEDEKLQMHDGTGKWLVTFFDIREDSFKWKYEVLTNTKEWKPISKISAQRIVE